MQSKIASMLAMMILLRSCIPRPGTATQTVALPALPASLAFPTATPFPPDSATPTTPPSATSIAATTSLPALTPTSFPTPTGALPDEAILILEPGSGSQLVDSIHLVGIAGPTFESHLLVQVLFEDGRRLISLPITLQAEMGSRGPFSMDIPFSIQERRQAFILISSSSPRDGGTTHLASVGVTLLPGGSVEIRPVGTHTERIIITQPTLGETLSGGIAHVEGVALPNFEGTLIVELLDAEGNLLASQPLIVQAPEMGQYGPFSIDLPYQVTAPGLGRVVVLDPSVVFQGDVHLASVEVNLEP